MALLPCRTRRRRTFKRRYELCERHTLTQTNAVFEFHVKNNSGKELVETIDLKKEANVYEGKAKGKADCIIMLSDDTFADLASGKVNGQKAFMGGKLKVKGNIMLATKLDGVLKAQRAKL